MVDADGSTAWFQHGELHRTDGPAIEGRTAGSEYDAWIQHGEYVRDDGPAVEYASGDHMWYHSGRRVTESAYAARNPEGYAAWQASKAAATPAPAFGAAATPVPVETATVHAHARATPTGGTAHVLQHTRRIGATR